MTRVATDAMRKRGYHGFVVRSEVLDNETHDWVFPRAVEWVAVCV